MALTFVRTVIIFITLLIIMRIMGKRQIGEMQPFEFVITLVIADLACIPMADSSIPLLYGIVAVISIFFVHQIVCLLDLSNVMKTYISGRPSIVINPNGVDMSQLRSNNLDISDLIESLRAAGTFALEDVNYAIYESNGNFSILSKKETSNSVSLPIVIINQGKFLPDNVKKCEVENDFFYKMIENKKEKFKRIDVLTIDGEGNVYFKPKGKEYKTFKVELPSGVSW